MRGLPYTRPVAIENLHELVTTDGGWMIPHAWIQAMPAALRTPLADQPGWKWIGLALILGALALFLSQTYRLSQLGRQHRFLQALAQFALPVSVLAVTPAAARNARISLPLWRPAMLRRPWQKRSPCTS